jgi:hypothetical protein
MSKLEFQVASLSAAPNHAEETDEKISRSVSSSCGAWDRSVRRGLGMRL